MSRRIARSFGRVDFPNATRTDTVSAIREESVGMMNIFLPRAI